MLNFKSQVFSITAGIVLATMLGACSGGPGAGPAGGDPNAVAARVNGKDIKFEEVEKALKAQGQGEEANFSPLELASARLTVLQQLIQTEVMFQKAEKEQTIPSDDDVAAEANKRKTASGLSAEEFERQMTKAGENEQSWKLNIKKELALQKLQEKISGRVDAPKDQEIDAFYNGNKEQFKNKRGAELAAIVIDPSNSGQGDTTINQETANIKAKEIGQRALSGADFATLAREASEDLQTRSNGGDWRYFAEDELKQTFGQGVTDFIMTKMQNGQILPQAIPLEGRILIIKLQRRQDVDEDLTLESPGVRQRVTELLINGRKSLLWQSYAAIAINEAKVENYLAKNVVDNPNELSGARPARTANANSNAGPAAASNVDVAPSTASNSAPVAGNTSTPAGTVSNRAAAPAPAANRPASANVRTASNTGTANR
ncbi:MAG: SurA N-terminal domain-containing protein [Acidobacteriota bacterium]